MPAPQISVVATAPEGPLVQLSNLQFRWPSAHADLLRIDAFEIARSERVFLHGPSGSGKSSLLGLLAGVARPTSGSVRVLDTPLETLKARQLDRFRADHVGYVFQLFNLVPYLSALDNVVLPCRFSERRKQHLARRKVMPAQEATRLLEALELDTDATTARNVTGLSIGQQQRVAVARALIGAPELLIADEPTSALDEGTRERFLELLFAECAASGTTVVLVSHDARIGELFDRRVSLGDLNSAAPAT
jgi:putative ABC transport system ATP-binding protein